MTSSSPPPLSSSPTDFIFSSPHTPGSISYSVSSDDPNASTSGSAVLNPVADDFSRRLCALLSPLAHPEVSQHRVLMSASLPTEGSEDTSDDSDPLHFTQEMSQPQRISSRPGYSYRVIRYASFHTLKKRKRELDSSGNRIPSVECDPQYSKKRRKILACTNTDRPELSRVPASLRRAESLRSVLDDDDDENDVAHDEQSKESKNAKDVIQAPVCQHVGICSLATCHSLVDAYAHEGNVPTVPSTPEERRSHAYTQSSLQKNTVRAGLCESLLAPVPIIAPPAPLPPPPTETPACLRIKRLIEREMSIRSEMQLSENDIKVANDCDWSWETSPEKRLRARALRWFMEIQTSHPASKGHTSSEIRHSICFSGDEKKERIDRASCCSITTCTDSTCTRTSSFSSTYSGCQSDCSGSCATTTTTPSTGSIESNSGTPKSRHQSSSSSSLTSSSCSSYYEDGQQRCKNLKPFAFDLYDQLATSPETRFHAAYLFHRFFYAVRGSAHGCDVFYGNDLDEEGRELVTWDLAVACLALSVKYHRDFLDPLLPVYSREFQDLAPHGPLSYDDLEAAHRDVLFALSFRLGDTPQMLLMELWNGLPELRRLLSHTDVNQRDDREWTWNCVQRCTWRVLFRAVLEHDVLRFPQYLLTAAALLQGVKSVLTKRYEDASPWFLYDLCSPSDMNLGLVKAYMGSFKDRAEALMRDSRKALMMLLNVSESALDVCLDWLSQL